MPLTNEELLTRARESFSSIDLDDDLKQAALKHLEDWLSVDKFADLIEPSDYRPLLEWMVASGPADLLLDSFYQVMPFGTGGRRGPVGVGPNRINPYTLAASIQGHVEYLRAHLAAGTDLKVVVAYDVRRFEDLRGVYPKEVANPMLGLSSKDLAQIAASVYVAAGVTVHMLPDQPADFISTPELSFLIRRYGAHGGLNTSASHNHPDDNGGKFYNASGGQEIPPDDERMVEIVERISEVRAMPYAEARASGKILDVTAEDRQAYIDLNLALRMKPEPGAAKIVFSGLHGTGVNTVGRCLQAMGFKKDKQYFDTPEQLEFRGDFLNVKFRSPNPEVPESLDLAIERAKQVGADLVLATDPDADRLGGASRRGDDFVFLNGNEFASMLARYRLEKLSEAGRMPKRPLVIKTQVTTELITRITEAFGGRVIGDLLVGFKYVGDILGKLEKEGRFGSIEASLGDFVLGTEESHGLLMTPGIRDKDAAGAAVVLAELASEMAAEGKTLSDYLVDTYKRYGYHRNFLRSTIMQGAAGNAAIRRIQQSFRESPPKEIGGRKVLSVVDYWNEEQFGPFVSETDRSSRNLLTFLVDGGIKATIRPSGTEPKNKVYIEKACKPLGAETSDEAFEAHRAEIDAEVRAFSNAFVALMLEVISVELPSYSYEISDLVSLENKRRFGDEFLPGLASRVKALIEDEGTMQSVQDWIDRTLAPFGPDARLLTGRAFAAYLAAARADGGDEALLGLEEKLFFRR